MDDIKTPSPAPGGPQDDPQVEQLDNVEPGAQPEHQPEPMNDMPVKEPKPGMKTWMVITLVIAALIIGAGGVYFWQQSQSNSDETEQLQSQVDELNESLQDAQDAADESNDEAKDDEIKTLTEQNDTLQAEVDTLTTSNDTLKTQNEALTTACEAATDCELPS